MMELIIQHPSGLVSAEIGNEVIYIGSAAYPMGTEAGCEDLQRAICVIQLNDLGSANAARDRYVQVAFAKRMLGEAQGILDCASLRESIVCLFIKLGYDTREIARRVGISTRGMESVRFRLHKKIGREKHESLKMYLAGV
uniref:HTH luxR-type domain-containing protein n=1 Tax=Chlorobium phaeovibrioides (strain DSM 265 / 1930) TaxID=290318 RepID=A4SGY8_CHLPM